MVEYEHLVYLISDNYDLAELKDLCFRLGVDYQSVPGGENKSAKARELHEYLRRRGRLSELMEQIHQDRPYLDLTPFGGPAPEQTSAASKSSPSETSSPQATTDTATDTAVSKTDAASQYVDFDIHIQPKRDDGTYQLNSESDYLGQSELVFQELPKDAAFEDQIYYLRELMADPEDAEKLGHELRGFLFPTPIWNQFVGTRQRARAESKEGVRVRIHIRRQSPELSLVPWEYCRDDRTFMALNEDTPLVRYMPTDREPAPITVPETVRILVVTANPADLDQLDIDQEKENIEDALANLVQSGRVQLEFVTNATRRDLRTKARRFKPHIFHFIGHGALMEGEGKLALVGRDGNKDLIDAEDMLVLLQGEETKLVILSACQSGAQDRVENEARALMGVGPKLIWGGTPAVVAMQFNMDAEASKQFTQDLYEFLADGKPLDAAMTEARIGLYFDFEDSQKNYWAIPVLFMRSPDGNIW